MTRGTVSVNNYVLELYSEDTYTNKVDTKTSTDGDFALTLDRTKDYYALLWADNDEAIYNTTNLKAVTLNDTKRPIEAFFGKTTIRGANTTLSVSLKRATAKINLCDKNGVEAGKKVNLQYSHYPAFNTVTGAVLGTAISENYDITSVATVANGAFGSFWMLAPTTASSTFDLTFKAADEAEATTVENITYQANHRTNVKGQYVEPPAKVGDYYYDDNTFSTEHNNTKTCIGIVFWIDPTDATKGKIVSLDESEIIDWGPTGVTTGATDVDDGVRNMTKIKAINGNFNDYPAFAWCGAKNTSLAVTGINWYIPAQNELIEICAWWDTNRDANNLIIETADGTALNLDGYYWASTEKTEDLSYYVYFNNKYSDGDAKSSQNVVRAISAF